MRETPQPPTTSPAGPPHDHTPGTSGPLPPSTEIDRVLQDSTETRARAHAREASPPVIPAKAGILSLGMDCPGRSVSDVSLGVAVP